MFCFQGMDLTTEQKETLVWYFTKYLDVAANTTFQVTLDKLSTLVEIMKIPHVDNRIEQVCEVNESSILYYKACSLGENGAKIVMESTNAEL